MKLRIGDLSDGLGESDVENSVDEGSSHFSSEEAVSDNDSDYGSGAEEEGVFERTGLTDRRHAISRLAANTNMEQVWCKNFNFSTYPTIADNR